MTTQHENGNSMSGSDDAPRGLSEPQGLLSRSAYLFRGRRRFLQLLLRPEEEILDPDTHEKIGFARDDEGGKWSIFGGGPAAISIYDKQGHPPLLTIRRDAGRLFKSAKAVVSAGDGSPLGYFREMGGIFNAHEQQVGEIGGWNERNPKPKLKFLDIHPTHIYIHGRVIGTRQNYWRKDTTLTLNEEKPASFFERAMLLASRYAPQVLPRQDLGGSAGG